MKANLKIIGVTVLIATVIIVGSNLLLFKTGVGVSFTELAGTDKLSDLDTIVNAALNALNNGKMEMSTTSVDSIITLSNLATIGTITSGVWNGTVIDVARQGTGTTSPTLDQVMIGNGASGFKVIGFGANGQFLTSGGADTTPSWTTSAIALGDDYDWTGGHNFTGNTYIKNLFASSTVANPLTLNGVGYSLPSTGGASSTVLMTNGSNALQWNTPYPKLYTDGTVYSTSNTSSTTAKTIEFSAGELTNNSILNIKAIVDGTSGAANQHFDINIGDGSSTTTLNHTSWDFGDVSEDVGEINITLAFNNSLSAWTYIGRSWRGDILIDTEDALVAGKGTTDLSGTAYIDFVYSKSGSANTAIYRGISVEHIANN